MLGEIESVQKDLTSLENDLASTGTAQTVDDLQAQIADIGDNM